MSLTLITLEVIRLYGVDDKKYQDETKKSFQEEVKKCNHVARKNFIKKDKGSKPPRWSQAEAFFYFKEALEMSQYVSAGKLDREGFQQFSTSSLWYTRLCRARRDTKRNKSEENPYGRRGLPRVSKSLHKAKVKVKKGSTKKTDDSFNPKCDSRAADKDVEYVNISVIDKQFADEGIEVLAGL